MAGVGVLFPSEKSSSYSKIHHSELNGRFPPDFKGLLKLKGVGDYTASAIASICYNEPTAVVDGNVYRVLSRVLGIDLPINSSSGIRVFKELAQLYLDPEQPGTYNQAIMEFGARYCVPKNPECGTCIFKEECVAFNTNSVSELPVKLKKAAVRKRHFNYLVILSEDDKTILNQRTKKGIWQQLYEFPLIETSEELAIESLLSHRDFQSFSKKFEIASVTLYNEQPVVHKLSHQHLITKFWIVETNTIACDGTPISSIKEYAVPVLIENFISDFPAI